jgi:hypothetical protein
MRYTIDTIAHVNLGIDFVLKEKYFVAWDSVSDRMEVYETFIIKCDEPRAL